MRLPLLLTVGLLVAVAPASAGTLAPPAPVPAPAASDGGQAVPGRVVHQAARCGKEYRGVARFDFRRTSDGMGAGTIKVRKGGKATASLVPGTYDVRIYTYQKKAFRYMTTRHLEVSSAGWVASFGCAKGSKQPHLKLASR